MSIVFLTPPMEIPSLAGANVSVSQFLLPPMIKCSLLEFPLGFKVKFLSFH